ncbi:MAG: FlgD immunoglobulin-like domain containing protein, partial [Candidatus Cloacimonadaceae bacterium]
PYGSYNYTQVKISSNGWVNLGANLTLPYYGNDLSYLNIRPLVAPLWDDLSLQFGAVQYNTYGDAPHRIFYVQWLAAKWNYNGMNEYSFMTRLHETGQIDFIYGPHIGAPNNGSASIGINMIPGGTNYFYSIQPGNPSVASHTTSFNTIQTAPAEGTMFIFMPKTAHPQNAAAVNLNGPQTPMQSMVANYTVTVGNAGSSPIASGAATAYLMRGDEVLTFAGLPSILPGQFADATLSWAPDTTGLMYLTGKVELTADPDSLNNVTYPFTITAQEFVGNDDEISPTASLQLSTQPNPFRENVSIRYSLPKADVTRLDIYDLKGRKVAALLRETKAQGSHTMVWSGLDLAGNPVPNGIYFGRMTSGSSAATVKLVRLK